MALITANHNLFVALVREAGEKQGLKKLEENISRLFLVVASREASHGSILQRCNAEVKLYCTKVRSSVNQL